LDDDALRNRAGCAELKDCKEGQMNAPLDRDQQIAMMKTAQERHLTRFAGWIGNHTVRSVLSRPVPGQEPSAYQHEVKRVACS
jgi:hypothetical protein